MREVTCVNKRLAVVVALAVFGLLGWQIWERVSEQAETLPKAKKTRAVAVVVEPVRTMTLCRIAEFTGTLESTARFVVAPKVSGRLEKLHLDIGDTVENGQLVAEVDSHEYAQELGEAQASLEVALASQREAATALGTAERDLKRANSLGQRGAISQAELDQAQAGYESSQARLQVAKAQVRQREAALEAAKVRLAYTRIHATWDSGPGTRVVGERFIGEGDMVAANDPIVSVVALDRLIAVINVIERDFPFVQTGQTAEIFTDAYPDRAFEGTLTRLAPVLQEASRQGRVEIRVPNPDRLLVPGMFARVRLCFSRKEGATAVPAAALARRDDRRGVFLVAENGTKARFVPFAPGIAEDGWVEVPAEAAEALVGGQVVTLGKHLLEDGGAILLPKSKQAGE